MKQNLDRLRKKIFCFPGQGGTITVKADRDELPARRKRLLQKLWSERLRQRRVIAQFTELRCGRDCSL